MNSLNKIAAGILTAAAIGYGGSASAMLTPTQAVADAYLQVNNFSLLSGTPFGMPPVAGKSFVGLTNVNILSVNNSGDVRAELNGTVADDSINNLPAGDGFVLDQSVGAGFMAGSFLPTGTISGGNIFAGSHSSTQGNALTGDTDPEGLGQSICGASHVFGDCVLTHNQINIDGSGTGTAFSNNSLFTTFTVDVGPGGQAFEMHFFASLFVRAGLGQFGGEAEASTNWLATVVDLNDTSGDAVLNWSPDGSVGLDAAEGTCVGGDVAMGENSCVELSDDFRLQQSRSIGNLPLDPTVSLGNVPGQPGEFEIELILQEGLYQFQITHESRADASIIVPEPGTLALMGLGILGAGVARRRAKQ